MTQSLREAATRISGLCRRLNQKNLLSAADGNVSFRLSEDQILITPSGVNKSELDPVQCAVITLGDRTLSGTPSSERKMHLEIYRRCPAAKAVVHAHPPTAIAWTIAQPDLRELPSECLSEIILSCGRIPIVPYARPGTAEMGGALIPFLPQCRVLILARHGALSWGESLEEAYNGMERLEHTALILKAAHELGGLSRLPAEEVTALRALREKLGERIL